ncbi:MAG: type II toxin-antitoxin system PemK/MazF family toxin [Propionibacteriaceae bacterium]|jgi:mRNA interferase MazF|nr:type II toxin-antitoxin system PemK/MazF family toxin [Propionibacteriaceae bacterium]
MVIAAFGSVVLAAGRPYSAKPRPVLIFQNDRFSTGESVVVIPFTNVLDPEAHYRVAVQPDGANGLTKPCWLEVDKISAIRRSAIGPTIGHLGDAQLERALTLAGQLMSAE